MKKRRGLGLLGFILIITLVMTACAKNAKEDSASDRFYSQDYSSNSGSTSYEYDSADTNYAPEAAAGVNEDGLSSTSSFTSGAESTQEKIIRKFYMDVETQDFDSLIDTIDAEIKRLDGYVESSQISGNSIYSSSNTRFGNVVVRIPSDRVDEFVSKVKDNANVTNRQETSENVSLEYIDMESRKEALQIEQDRLFAIMEKEMSLDNIISLESRLSDIRYEIQNLESQLRYYDNLVEYSTVTLKIQEVDKITPVVEKKQSAGEKIKTGFSESMYNIGKGFENFFVWLIINLPYLLIWGIIIAIIVIVVRRLIKKSNANKKTHPQPVPIPYGQLNFGQNGAPNNQVQQNPGQYHPGNPSQAQPNQGQSNSGQPGQGK